MKLKVCGIKHQANAKAVESISPDYMGFIFYSKSARFVSDWCGDILEPSTKKVGVFVNETIAQIVHTVRQYRLQAIQLHGKESVAYCKSLNEALSKNRLSVEVIKVFSVLDHFDFSLLPPFEPFCDYFLFDTKGALPGGNGTQFKWSLLQQYPSKTPFFLSGGIGLAQLPALREFFKSDASQYCYAIDVNSQFEIAPGLKDAKALKQFKKELDNIKNTI